MRHGHRHWHHWCLVGGFAFSLIGGSGISGFNLWSVFVAVIGAIVFIAVVRALRKNT